MERFFILDKFNTWYDWRLILTAKDVTPPEPKTNYVDIDGMSGTLDLSEALTGEITYKDRTISASFWTNEGTFKERSDLLRKIVTALHGKKMKIIEPDDPDHYFYGRVKVKSLNNILPYATFTIECTCEPWRYSVADTVRTIKPNADKWTDVVIHNHGVKTVCPEIVVTDFASIKYGEFIEILNAGSYKFSDIKFYQGANVVSILGGGSVTFKYKEADL
jgi:phage-related protein